MTETVTPELLRSISIVELSAAERQVEKIHVDAVECAAIAERLDILSIESLSAELELFRDLTGDVNLVGRILADIVQACVVTLEPVAQHIDVRVYQRFSARLEEDEGDDEDPVEPIVDDEIEVGDLIVQNLSLALDPYPRAPDAEFEEVDDEAGKPSGPFAALAALRDDDKK
ncbi:MAG: YceD family protein [Alphaproteobacteria bacterium]